LDAFVDRVHVRCTNAPNAISYFAVSTSNSAVAARFSSMASLAVGGYLWIDYDFFDTSGPSFGCQLGDCRRALSWKLAQ
jgi:hypothetical protein